MRTKDAAVTAMALHDSESDRWALGILVYDHKPMLFPGMFDSQAEALECGRRIVAAANDQMRELEWDWCLVPEEGQE